MSTLPHVPRDQKVVEQLQRMLVENGISVGSSGTDGIMGKDTRRAEREFEQQYSKKDLTDLIGQAKTLAATETPDTPLQVGRVSKRRDLKTAQAHPDQHDHVNASWKRVDPSSSYLADPNHVRDLQKAWLKHEQGPKPDLNVDGRSMSWNAVADKIKAEPDLDKKIEIANAAIDQTLHYRGHLTNADGSTPRNAHWISTPWDAVHHSGSGPNATKEHSICGDQAAAKVFLLRDAGVPANQLSLISVAPGAGDTNYHVVVGVKTESGLKVMEMGRKGTGVRGPLEGKIVTVGDKKSDPYGTTQRGIVHVVAADVIDHAPANLLASTQSTTHHGKGIKLASRTDRNAMIAPQS